MSKPEFPATADRMQAAYNAWLADNTSGDRELERFLNRHAKRADAPVVVRDRDGGRAAIAAWLHRQLAKGPERLFYHFPDACRDARRPAVLVRRLLDFLKRLEGFREPIPASADAQIEILPNWLARAAARDRLVVVIPHLDALEGVDEGAVLDWLPEFLPAAVRLVVGVAGDAAQRAAVGRGFQSIDAAAQEPLSLPAVELPEALAAVWASRYGLSEAELESLGLAVPQAAGTLLYQVDDRYVLSGAEVQDAVRRHLLPDGVERQQMHVRLAERCFSGKLTARGLDELPWQLAEAAHWEALWEVTLQPAVLEALLEPGWREELVTLWPQLAELEQVCTRYAAALDTWAGDLEPRRLASLIYRLALALEDAGAPGESVLPLLDRAVALKAELDADERIGLRVALAVTLADGQASEQARQELEALLAEAESTLGADAAATRNTRHALATQFEYAGDLAAAASLYRRTLECREQALGGQRHVALIPHLINLAAVLKADNAFDAAKPLYQRALSIAERSYGNAHPTTAACLDNLAGLLYAGQDFTAAEDYYQRALGIAEQAFGPAHPATAASAHNLGTVMDAREQFKAAEELFRRALDIRQAVYGDDHMDTASSLHNLAGVLDAMGRYPEAEPMYRRAVETWEKVVGKEHPATATSVNNLADLLREKGDYAEAEGLYRRNLETWSRLLGEQHPHTVMTRAELAGLYADQGDAVRAEPMLREAVDQTGQIMGVDNMQHINAVTRLAALLRQSGRVDEAKTILRQVSRQVEGKVGLLSPALQKLQRHLEALDVNSDRLH